MASFSEGWRVRTYADAAFSYKKHSKLLKSEPRKRIFFRGNTRVVLCSASCRGRLFFTSCFFFWKSRSPCCIFVVVVEFINPARSFHSANYDPFLGLFFPTPDFKLNFFAEKIINKFAEMYRAHQWRVCVRIVCKRIPGVGWLNVLLRGFRFTIRCCSPWA